jgi:hypothetical protein
MLIDWSDLIARIVKLVLRRAMIKKYTSKNIDDWEFDVY